MLLPITALHRNEIFTRAASISCYRSCRNSSKLGLLIKAELFKTRASCSSSQGLPCQLCPTDSIRGQGLARALWACRVTSEVTFWSEQTLECFCQKRKATQADCDLSVRAVCHRWWWQHLLLPFDLPWCVHNTWSFWGEPHWVTFTSRYDTFYFIYLSVYTCTILGCMCHGG